MNSKSKKITIIIIGSILLLAFILMIIWAIKEPGRKREAAMKEIATSINDALGNSSSSVYLRYDIEIGSLSEDEEIANYIKEKNKELIKQKEWAVLSAFTEELDSKGYKNSNVTEALKEELQALSFSEMLTVTSSFNGHEIFSKIITNEIVDRYFETTDSSPIRYEENQGGYYDDPKKHHSEGRSYGKYGTYTDRSYTYYGDFAICSKSGYTTKSLFDLTTVPVSGKDIFFKGVHMEGWSEIPPAENCHYFDDILCITFTTNEGEKRMVIYNIATNENVVIELSSLQ